MSSQKKGKEDCQNPLTVLAANLTGDNLPDPWWFSSTPSWGGTLFLRQLPGGQALPRTGDSPAGRSTRCLVWCAQLWGSHPFMGRSLGHCLVKPDHEKEETTKQEKAKNNKK